MRFRLDVFAQQIPGQEPEAKPALARPNEEQVYRVDDLRAGDVDGDGAEVLCQAVADKDDAQVQQQPELLVGDFEADEGVARAAAVEITGRDARKGRQVVHHRLRNGNVVVDKGLACVLAGPAQDADARKAEPRGADGLARAVGFDFDFFALQRHELGVDGDGCAGRGGLGCGGKDAHVFGFGLVAGRYVEEN